LLGIGGGVYAYDVSVNLQGDKASGAYRLSGEKSSQFEVGLLPDGTPDLDNQNVKISSEAGGMKKEFLYHADTKMLDVTQTLTDEWSFYNLV
jgi:hypothetical protein